MKNSNTIKSDDRTLILFLWYRAVQFVSPDISRYIACIDGLQGSDDSGDELYDKAGSGGEVFTQVGVVLH